MNTLIPLIGLFLIQIADADQATLELPVKERILADLRPARPRVLATQDDFDRVRRLIRSDERAKRWYASVEKRGEGMLKQPPTAYEIPDGLRLLQQSRRTLDRAVTLGLLYRLTGDPRYRDRIWRDVEAAAGFPNWNPRHFLDVGEMTCAFAVAYDWLYDAWSAEQRATIRAGLVRHGLETARKAYQAERKPRWVRATNNWNQVCNGGIAVGAIAVAEEHPKLAAEVLHHALGNLPVAVASFAPDGACVEGPGYWAYATRYYVFLLATLSNALGRDFGLSALPAVDRLGDFPVLLRSPTNRTFNFADCGERTPVDAGLLWLAHRFGRPIWAKYQIERTGGSALDLLWYRPGSAGSPPRDIPLDMHFRHADVLVMRSAWNDPQAWYLGCKAGDNRFPHGNLDVGSFVLEALGQRWAVDLGRDNYNLPGYWSGGRGGRRWTFYRLRAQGHNTLVIRPGGHDDQVPSAAGQVQTFESKPDRAVAVIDMTAAYADWATHAQRTFILNRQAEPKATVTVRDDLELKQPDDVYWFMHTKASVAIDADDQRARLDLNSKTLYAHLVKPANGRFRVLDASPLPGTPDPERQARNEGVRRLTIKLEQVSASQIEVVFSASPDLPQATKAASDQQGRPVQITGDGAWCWFADPRAVYYEGKHKRTYVGWVSRSGDIQIGSYDHESGAIDSATIHEQLNKDDHASPAIVIRPDGRLLVFYTAHSVRSIPMHSVLSKNPEDITTWEAPRPITTNTPGDSGFCYPNPVQLSAEDNRIYLFWRGGNWRPTFATSDDGVSWAPARTLIEGRPGDRGNRPYCKFATNGKNRIDVAFTTGHPRNEPQNNIYYASYRNGALFRADGTKIKGLEELPLRFDQAELVYDAKKNGDARAWIWDVAIGSDGHPVVTYVACPAESDHRYRYARWDGNKWVDNEICAAGGWFPSTPSAKREPEPHYSGGVVLDHNDPSIVYLSRPRNGVFEIERWTTPNSGRTWSSAAVTTNSSNNNVRPFVARNHSAGDSGLFWMRGEYVHYLNFRTAIRMHRTPRLSAGRAPAGFALIYNQGFSSRDSLDDFVFSDPNAWRLAAENSDRCLELYTSSEYEPQQRSPRCIAIVSQTMVGDFVLEADIMQTGREYGHRDLCVFFGVNDPSHFYYAHIASKADDVSHQIHIVNGGPRTPITSRRNDGVAWGRGQWHRVRVERRVEPGTIRVFLDDMSRPILEAEDKTFGAGFVGFGSFDDMGRIDDIRLWSPDAQVRKAGFFLPPKNRADAP